MTTPFDSQDVEDPGRQLSRLCQDFVSRLNTQASEDPAGREKAAFVQQHVVDRLNRVAADRVQLWLAQTEALVAWHEAKTFVASAEIASGVDLGQLEQACERLLRRFGEVERSKLTQEVQTLFGDAAALLVRCRDAYREHVKPATGGSTGDDSGSGTAELGVDTLIEKLTPRWLPARLMQFHAQLQEQDARVASGLIANVRKLVGEQSAVWRTKLHEVFPDHDAEMLDAVVLLRALLETLAQALGPPTIWPALLLLARDLVPQTKLNVELIRDPKQPAEWFSSVEEANVRAAVVSPPGWALRSSGKPWFCFPQGKKRVPKPRLRTPTVDAAEQMLALVQANGWLSPLAAHALEMIDITAAGESDGADRAAGALLDSLVQAIGAAHQGTEAAISFRKLPKTHTHVLDQLLEHARRWCGNFGLEILPREWSFSTPMPHDRLHDDERACAYFFRPDEVRGGVYRVRSFGLRQGERLLRECAVSVSAGPAPAGLQELEEVIKVAVDHGEEVLIDRVRSWREAALQGTLDLVIVQFYVDFWGELGDELRRQHPDLAQDFSMRLFDLLKREFKLYPFYPVAYQDHPDGWLQRVSGRSMVTGRVRRIARPGLQDDNGQLRVPALVEVE